MTDQPGQVAARVGDTPSGHVGVQQVGEPDRLLVETGSEQLVVLLLGGERLDSTARPRTSAR